MTPFTLLGSLGARARRPGTVGHLLRLGAIAFAFSAPLAPGAEAATLPAGGADDGTAAVVERVGALLIENYVFEAKARETDAALRQALADGAFDGLSADTLASALTEHVQAVTHDKHLRVGMRSFERAPEVSPEDAERFRRERGRESNFGFEQVLRLPDNVGVIDLRGFQRAADARDTAVAAMNFLGHCDALVFDLRQNGGGDPETVALISSWLFDEPTHLNSLYWRGTDETEEFWTHEVPGPSLADVPVVVVTSQYTFSAAEEFAYNLRCLERATIVGETTGGGAHPGDRFVIDDDFDMFISTGRAINPITGTNWEGTGVEPHVDAPSAEALDEGVALARKLARERRQARETIGS